MPSLNVLVVEDDPDLAALEAELLEEHGHHVEVANNGREALAAVERAAPDLILLDMKMPVMGGREFADEYRRAQPSPAPIVVITAADDAQVRAAGVCFDAEDLFRIRRAWGRLGADAKGGVVVIHYPILAHLPHSLLPAAC